ncbi:hypothetical protein [Pseudomonas sp. PDM05]|uniref:hypothetical protein n=1 Tax=Pseudomonas sp. PDM05 TaxID=2769301 RepID=UPI001CE16A02|nr:hypothetical protein [Pseudomonas sp. PDM05]
MNQLKQQQAAFIQELETLKESLPQLEAEWRNAPSGFSANGNVIGSPESRDAMERLSSVTARIDAIPGELASIDRKLQHLERLEKIGQIKADAIQAMTDATAEVEALERRKSHLNERFQTIQSEADQALQKAQQAERDAATSYAKCLASGDAEGENQQAAKCKRPLSNWQQRTSRSEGKTSSSVLCKSSLMLLRLKSQMHANVQMKPRPRY